MIHLSRNDAPNFTAENGNGRRYHSAGRVRPTKDFFGFLVFFYFPTDLRFCIEARACAKAQSVFARPPSFSMHPLPPVLALFGGKRTFLGIVEQAIKHSRNQTISNPKNCAQRGYLTDSRKRERLISLKLVAPNTSAVANASR